MIQPLVHSLALLTASTAGIAAAATPVEEREPTTLHVDAPRVAISGVPFQGLKLSLRDAGGAVRTDLSGPVTLSGLEWATPAGDAAETPAGLTLVAGILLVEKASCRVEDGRLTLQLQGAGTFHARLRLIPGWQSLLPPLVAIVCGLLLRQMIIALGLGVLVGMTILHDYRPDIGFLRAVDTKLVAVFTDVDHAHVILFSLMLGGMVGIISRSGGTQGIVEAVARYARTARSGQVATWAMGLFIFFDDYANTLIVGNTMRPITDRLRISREKLAYLVDSTAAPVAGLVLVSTWIGTEVGLIKDAIAGTAWPHAAYATFVQAIPYSFYSLFTLAFVLLIGATGRDFGPMRVAEQRAAREGKLMRDGAQPLSDPAMAELTAPDGKPKRWINAVLPVGVIVFVAIGGIYYTGRLSLGGAADMMGFKEIFWEGDAYRALVWSGAIGCIVAGGMAWVQRLGTIDDIVGAWMTGMKSMALAVVILLLAWSVSSLCRHDLHTGTYIAVATRGMVPTWAIPTVTFLIAGVISYAMGTSYGTMGILIPLVVPYAILASDAAPAIVLPTVGAVLAGAIFGDHCSPLSDTTILSSMASGCDHVDHVNTQMPYALAAAGVAVVVGYIPAGLGVSPWILLPAGLATMWAMIRIVGKPVTPN